MVWCRMLFLLNYRKWVKSKALLWNIQKKLGICESVITIDKEVDEDGSKLAPGGLVYINWLFVDDRPIVVKNLLIIYYIPYYCMRNLWDATE